jgi:hypothetical protein
MIHYDSNKNYLEKKNFKTIKTNLLKKIEFILTLALKNQDP